MPCECENGSSIPRGKKLVGWYKLVTPGKWTGRSVSSLVSQLRLLKELQASKRTCLQKYGKWHLRNNSQDLQLASYACASRHWTKKWGNKKKITLSRRYEIALFDKLEQQCTIRKFPCYICAFWGKKWNEQICFVFWKHNFKVKNVTNYFKFNISIEDTINKVYKWHNLWKSLPDKELKSRIS